LEYGTNIVGGVTPGKEGRPATDMSIFKPMANIDKS
jgi:succinyl-CoA synthetase alpha subunit